MEITSSEWGGILAHNSASITAVTGPSCESPNILQDDFKSVNLMVNLWCLRLFPISQQVFGPSGSKTINLDLSALPTILYKSRFDLYIFDSWDGNNVMMNGN